MDNYDYDMSTSFKTFYLTLVGNLSVLITLAQYMLEDCLCLTLYAVPNAPFPN